MKIKIEIREEDLPKKRRGLLVACLKRHSRRQVMRDRRMRRAKDARKSWRKEWD